MKALVYKAPHTLVMETVDDPVVESFLKADSKMIINNKQEVIVQVKACGICGSDMHAFFGHDDRRPAPLILGHEVSGLVLDSHQRVTVNPLVTCGDCAFCQSGRDNLCAQRQIISMVPRQGGFAEKIKIPVENLVEVPAGFSLENAAVVEPLACGWHASRLALTQVESSGRIKSNLNALILGGGAIGVGSALSLFAQGVKNITIVEPNKLRAEQLLLMKNINVITDVKETDQDDFVIIIDGVGINQTREAASQMASPGGVIVHIGLGAEAQGLDIRRMTLQEITFIGSYTYTKNDFKETAQALFDGSLGALEWIEKRPLEQGAQAFNDIRNGKVASAKILLKP